MLTGIHGAKPGIERPASRTVDIATARAAAAWKRVQKALGRISIRDLREVPIGPELAGAVPARDLGAACQAGALEEVPIDCMTACLVCPVRLSAHPALRPPVRLLGPARRCPTVCTCTRDTCMPVVVCASVAPPCKYVRGSRNRRRPWCTRSRVRPRAPVCAAAPNCPGEDMDRESACRQISELSELTARHREEALRRSHSAPRRDPHPHCTGGRAWPRRHQTCPFRKRATSSQKSVPTLRAISLLCDAPLAQAMMPLVCVSASSLPLVALLMHMCARTLSSLERTNICVVCLVCRFAYCYYFNVDMQICNVIGSSLGSKMI